MKKVLTVTMDSTSIMAQSLKCPIKQRSPSLKTVRSMPMRQQHLPNCWLTPLWPNSSKILQRTYKPLYINGDSFPIGKTAAVLHFSRLAHRFLT